MKRNHVGPTAQWFVLVLLSAAAPVFGTQAVPSEPGDPVLLFDHFDEDFVPDGTRCTSPAKIRPAEGWTGGRPGKGGQFVQGRVGKALRFHGLMQLTYPTPGNLDMTAGAAEFWVALGFDAAETIKNPGELSNQLFFTVWGPGGSMVSIYSTLVNTCVGVWDAQRQLVCYGGFPGYWKKDEWHHLELRWGRQLELWCDGQRKVAEDWQGLFGPIDVQPDQLRLTLGSHLGYSSVESEFAVDELRILGPGEVRTPDYPIMTVPRIRPPVIDGKIASDEWDGAAQTTGFVGLNDPVLVADQTIVRAGWSDEALYLCYECLDSNRREPIGRLQERDSGIFQEDAVDAILQPEPGRYPYYHLAASAIGTPYDSRVDPKNPAIHDLKFNPNWTVRTGREPGRWAVECQIPFRELDGRPAPKEGQRWRVNFCRDREPISRCSSWAYAAGDFHRTERFGEIVFSPSDRGIRLGPLGDWPVGKLSAQVALTGLLFDPLVTVRGRVMGTDAKTIVETENRLADYRAVSVQPPTLVTGLYHLRVRAATAQGVMYDHRLPFRVFKPYDISVEGYPYQGELQVRSNVAGLTEAPKGLVARAHLNQGDKVFGTCQTDQFERGIGRAAFDIRPLPPGKYVVKSEAVAPDGKVLATAEADFEQFPRPAWWQNKIGIDHSVPSPWQPVRVSDEAIEVWGRQYRCADKSLPQQIVNQGEAMLSGPVSLKLSAEGTSVELADLPAAVVAVEPDVVVRQAETELGRLKARLTTSTEFDGLQRCDLTLEPSGPVDVASLVLEIPVQARFATFLLPSNGIAASAVAMESAPWRSAMLPQVWLGNDDVGLAWFAESDEHWRPRDHEMLEVVPEADRTVIRCRIFRSQAGGSPPMRLEKPITITFGLMATPVKDGHAGDPFWFRFSDVMGSSAPMEFLRYPGRGNVDVKQGTLEFCVAPARDLGGPWREVMSLAGQDGGLSLSMNCGSDPTMVLTVDRGERKDSSTAKGLALKPNEYTHVAVTWGDMIQWYVAGKRVGALEPGLPPDMVRSPEKLALRFGCAGEWNGSTRIAIDELRVSNAVRYQGDILELPAGPFAKDSQTLLLDHLDERFRPDGEDAESRAEAISGQSGELGGVPSLGCQFVEGRFGSGLEIANGPSLEPGETARRYGYNASLFWFWMEENATTTGWPPPLMQEPLMAGLRSRVKQHNELGLRPCPYMGYPALGAPCPLSAQFGHEWSRRPLSTQPYEPPKGHYLWDVCPQSGFADYMAAGTEWVLNDLGFCGCYTDGLAQVAACQNTHHGCGYYDDQGALHSTWPLFAAREMLKRMYRQIHARRPDGYLVNHVSFNTIIPAMSFTDVYYTGEHEQYEDLTKFRVRWQGRPWGIWPILLGDDSHSYVSMHMTYSLLHGVSVWPQGFLGRNDMSRKTANLWKAYDAFGYREAEWVPYYRAEKDLAQADRPEVKVSLYLARGKRVLLVVGNLAHEVVACQVKLDLKAMGLDGTTALNALDGRPVALEDGVLSIRLRPTSFVLAQVE